MRVTHSIPDCCGMILRSEHGTIVHTGDWNHDKNPVDNDRLDLSAFEDAGRTLLDGSGFSVDGLESSGQRPAGPECL